MLTKFVWEAFLLCNIETHIFLKHIYCFAKDALYPVKIVWVECCQYLATIPFLDLTLTVLWHRSMGVWLYLLAKRNICTKSLIYWFWQK